MYKSMMKELYCVHVASDVYDTVRDCRSCTQDRTHGKKQRDLKLFFPDGALEHVSMDILGPLLKTKHGNQFVTPMTDRYTKLTRAISTKKTNDTAVSRIFFEHCVANFGIS